MNNEDIVLRRNILYTIDKLKAATNYFAAKKEFKILRMIKNCTENLVLYVKLMEKNSLFINKHSAFCIQIIDSFILHYRKSSDPGIIKIILLQKELAITILKHMNKETTVPNFENKISV